MPAKLELLGGFRLTSSQTRTVDVSAKKNRALLGILALAPHCEVTRDRLVALLWSDRAEEQAKNSLRQALVALRKDLTALDADLLVTKGDRLALDRNLVTVDVVKFLAASASIDPSELQLAADLYKGPLLDGLNTLDNAFEDWLREARIDLTARAVKVLGELAKSVAGPERIAFAERLIALEPLSEASHIALMWGNDENRLGRELFEAAILLDPRCAIAYAYCSLALVLEHDFENAPQTVKDKALEGALTAVRLDAGDSRCQQILAMIYLLKGNFAAALAL